MITGIAMVRGTTATAADWSETLDVSVNAAYDTNPALCPARVSSIRLPNWRWMASPARRPSAAADHYAASGDHPIRAGDQSRRRHRESRRGVRGEARARPVERLGPGADRQYGDQRARADGHHATSISGTTRTRRRSAISTSPPSACPGSCRAPARSPATTTGSSSDSPTTTTARSRRGRPGPSAIACRDRSASRPTASVRRAASPRRTTRRTRSSSEA